MAKKNIGFDALLESTVTADSDKKTLSKEESPLTVRIPKELHKQLRMEAVNRGTTLREIVITALKKEL